MIKKNFSREPHHIALYLENAITVKEDIQYQVEVRFYLNLWEEVKNIRPKN